MDFIKPTIEYAEISPLFIVFGAAIIGVLVEAFVARQHRHVVQVALAAAGVVGALVATVLVGLELDEVGGGAGRGLVGAEGSVVVDGPAVYLWGLVLVFS